MRHATMKEYCSRREKRPRQERQAGKSTTDMVSTSTTIHSRRASARQAATRWRLPAAGWRPARTVHAEQRGIDRCRSSSPPASRGWVVHPDLHEPPVPGAGAQRCAGCDGAVPPVPPLVLYNGEARRRAAVEVGESIAPVGPELAPYQPSQRHVVVDERHVGVEDLPASNPMAAVSGLARSRPPEDVVRVAGARCARSFRRGRSGAARRRTWCGWRRCRWSGCVTRGTTG